MKHQKIYIHIHWSCCTDLWNRKDRQIYSYLKNSYIITVRMRSLVHLVLSSTLSLVYLFAALHAFEYVNFIWHHGFNRKHFNSPYYGRYWTVKGIISDVQAFWMPMAKLISSKNAIQLQFIILFISMCMAVKPILLRRLFWFL